jgi:tubulin-specific chaperone A
MAPSQTQIAISSLQRLLKEEKSYYTEQEQQEARIAKLENEANSNDENHEYQLKQEVSHRAAVQTPRSLTFLDRIHRLDSRSKRAEKGWDIDVLRTPY